eukprot:5990712-Pleurochrysis_carterae.AAC.1
MRRSSTVVTTCVRACDGWIARWAVWAHLRHEAVCSTRARATTSVVVARRRGLRHSRRRLAMSYRNCTHVVL